VPASVHLHCCIAALLKISHLCDCLGYDWATNCPECWYISVLWHKVNKNKTKDRQENLSFWYFWNVILIIIVFLKLWLSYDWATVLLLLLLLILQSFSPYFNTSALEVIRSSFMNNLVDLMYHCTALPIESLIFGITCL